MQLLIMVLNKTECLNRLLAELIKNDIRGATILDSAGMVKAAIDLELYDFFGTIGMMGQSDKRSNKTIFMALEDEKVEKAIAITDEIVGGIDNPDTCFLMVLPLLYVRGSYKNGAPLPTKKERKRATPLKANEEKL